MNTEQSTKIHAGAQPIGANMMKIDATWDKEAGSLVATTPIGYKITMATTDHLLDSGKIPVPMFSLYLMHRGVCPVHSQ